jgi:hypothetical protein
MCLIYAQKDYNGEIIGIKLTDPLAKICLTRRITLYIDGKTD